MNERSERLALLLDPGTQIVDPMDPATWLVGGRPASPEQVAMLRSLSLQDLDDVTTLLRLDVELRTVADAREVVSQMRAFLLGLDGAAE